MSKHIQPISHYERIKMTNLTKGSVRSRRGAEVVEEGAKASQNIMWLLCLCIKPETSET